MKKAIIILALAILPAFVSVSAQKPVRRPAAHLAPEVKVTPQQPYNSDHAQLAYAREKILQSQFSQMQQAVKDKTAQLQVDYAKEEQVLKEWEASVRAANKWDDSYTYNRDTDTWARKVVAPKKK